MARMAKMSAYSGGAYSNGLGSHSHRSVIKVQPEFEIVISKQEVIYTDENDNKHLMVRIHTNNKVYWLYNNEILETSDTFEDLYKIVNRDSKINTLLGDELG